MKNSTLATIIVIAIVIILGVLIYYYNSDIVSNQNLYNNNGMINAENKSENTPIGDEETEFDTEFGK